MDPITLGLGNEKRLVFDVGELMEELQQLNDCRGALDRLHGLASLAAAIQASQEDNLLSNQIGDEGNGGWDNQFVVSMNHRRTIAYLDKKLEKASWWFCFEVPSRYLQA